MTRNMACSFALGALALLVPTTGSAQTFVDVGVWTRGGGGRVVVAVLRSMRLPSTPPRCIYPEVYYPPVYYARPVYRPVYVAQPYYRHDRGRHLGWYKNNKKGRVVYGGGRYYDPYYAGYDYGRYDRRGRRR